MEPREYIYNGSEPKRLDAALAFMEPELSRSMAKKLIEQQAVTVNGSRRDTDHKVKAGDKVVCLMPDAEPYEVTAENIPIDIVYEDGDLAVINKGKGMVVHPAPGHPSGTLVNAIMYHIKDLSGVGGVERPGIVHRLDMDTTGLIVIAKNDAAHRQLSAQLEDKTMNRRYIAVCKGNFKEECFEVEKPIDRSKNDRKKMAVCREGEGRYAKTAFRVLEQVEGYSLLECRLFTGRTHQIRVHLSHISHPIVGDTVYGKKAKVSFERQALHGYRLEFIHPATKAPMVFTAPVPEDINALMKKLKFREITVDELA